jgi:site-specific DNA-adenine methylase
MKKLRRFIPVYGGKRSIAGKYPPPTGKAIWEPFAGGAGYSLEYPHLNVHLVDIDERICAVWDFLIHASSSDIMSIPAHIQHVDELNASQAVKWLVGWWMSPAAASGPATRAYSWVTDPKTGHAGRSDVWSEKCRARLAAQVDQIRHWTIQLGSYDILDVSRDGTWFVDPPYVDMGRHYKHGSVGFDFAALAVWCKSLTGQVIVCENAGATWLPFEPLCEMVGGQRHRKTEVYWTNG